MKYSLNFGVSILLFLILLLVNTRCKYHTANEVVNPVCSLPDTISFKEDVVPIFELSCDQATCHSGTESRGRVNLEPDSAYYSLFERKLIDTLYPTHSQVYSRLTNANNLMPPGEPLGYCQIQTILKWIEQGARNN